MFWHFFPFKEWLKDTFCLNQADKKQHNIAKVSLKDMYCTDQVKEKSKARLVGSFIQIFPIIFFKKRTNFISSKTYLQKFLFLKKHEQFLAENHLEKFMLILIHPLPSGIKKCCEFKKSAKSSNLFFSSFWCYFNFDVYRNDSRISKGVLLYLLYSDNWIIQLYSLLSSFECFKEKFECSAGLKITRSVLKSVNVFKPYYLFLICPFSSCKNQSQ